MTFDPFGDFATRGYLRNFAGVKDPAAVRELEHVAYVSHLGEALAALESGRFPSYGDVLATHHRLSVRFIPGQAWTAWRSRPTSRWAVAGAPISLAHPQDIGRAIEYGLGRARDPDVLRLRPGEILGYLAYGHPFLEGNGRMLLAVHVDLCARAGFHVDWRKIGRGEFLEGLTRELEQPGSALDNLLRPHLRAGTLSFSAEMEMIRGIGAPAPSNTDPASPPSPLTTTNQPSLSERIAELERRHRNTPRPSDAASPKGEAKPETGPERRPSKGPSLS